MIFFIVSRFKPGPKKSAPGEDTMSLDAESAGFVFIPNKALDPAPCAMIEKIYREDVDPSPRTHNVQKGAKSHGQCQ